VTRARRLSAYDASYLDLAMREALPLSTMDESLRSPPPALRASFCLN
jgi:predicted nucleic acid-binding protein